MEVKRVDSSGNIVPIQYQGVDITPTPTVESYSETNATINLTTVADIPNNTVLVFNENPYYINQYNGDPRFLQDKFVRFSYRFNFVDGESSLMAPFTQPCFIPKQDGYFLNESLSSGDMEHTYSSTIVEFMENKVNKIDLKIPLPVNGSLLNQTLHVESIDILYKESDSLTIQVIENISTTSTEFSNINIPELTYFYQSQKPYRTLPSSDITRVYDKIPVRALGQEIISNRVVYANYQDKHTPPSFINYNVTATAKSNLAITGAVTDTTSIVEYPSSSLKTNRTYQVGVVLSDKFGRQSTTILSNSTASITIGPPSSSTTFSGSTLYSPYSDEGVVPREWPGNSLKIIFNSIIGNASPNAVTLDPGLYNGDVFSASYNPLGWYSYKIVVKQTEQEYYNIYTAGAIKGLPFDYVTNSVGSLSQNSSFVSLINDNINKVPRDLSEVGPQDRTFRSSVILYGRVENISNNQNTGNNQFYPSRKAFTTTSIETLDDLFDVSGFTGQFINPVPVTDNLNAYHGFFKSDANPFIAEIVTSQSTSGQFGTQNSVEVFTGTGKASAAYADTDTITLDGIGVGSVIEIGSIITWAAAGNDPPLPGGKPVVVESTNNNAVTPTLTLNRKITIASQQVVNLTLRKYEDTASLAVFETDPFVSKLDINYWFDIGVE